MNNDVKNLLVHIISFMIAVVVSVLTIAFCAFMFKVCIRLTTFAWELV